MDPDDEDSGGRPTPQHSAPQHPGPKRPRRGRRLVVGLVAVGSVVAVLAGLLLWSARTRDTGLAAVRQAVDALLVTPAVRMRTTSADGTVRADLRVTATGEAVGDLVVDGRWYEFLAVADRTWLRSADGRLPGGPVGAGSDPLSDVSAAALLAGQWVAVDLAALDPTWRVPPSPTAAAVRVRAALAADPDAVELDEDGPVVGGTPTIVAHTPAGDVHVSRVAPHRVLRISAGPTGGYALGHDHAGPAVALVAFQPGEPTPAPTPPAPGPDLDLTDLGPAAGRVYEDVEKAVPELADAGDATLDLGFAARPRLTCGPEGCTGRVTVRARVAGVRRGTVGAARATLSVTVAIEGRPAGECETEAELVVGKDVRIECSVPAAGPVFSAVREQKRSAAIAATAPGGTARWKVDMKAVALVVGRADVDVRQIEQDVASSRQDLLCLDPDACPDLPHGGPYTGHLIPVDKRDDDAVLLARRLNGTHSVYFEDDPTRSEIDAVNDEYIAETKKASVTFSGEDHEKARRRFDAARQTGRAVYYHFEGGAPRDKVRTTLERYAVEYGVRLVVDTEPLR